MTRDLSRETLEASKRRLAGGLRTSVPGGTQSGPLGILHVCAVGPGLLPLIHGPDENVFTRGPSRQQRSMAYRRDTASTQHVAGG